MPKKVGSMSLSKYFEITKNHYTTFQIIPAKHSKSNNSDALAGIVNKIYLNLNSSEIGHVRTLRAKVTLQTREAPAAFSVLAHSASVAPVVIMSSTTRTVLPRTYSGCLTAKVPFTFSSLSSSLSEPWRANFPHLARTRL